MMGRYGKFIPSPLPPPDQSQPHPLVCEEYARRQGMLKQINECIKNKLLRTLCVCVCVRSSLVLYLNTNVEIHTNILCLSMAAFYFEHCFAVKSDLFLLFLSCHHSWFVNNSGQSRVFLMFVSCSLPFSRPFGYLSCRLIIWPPSNRRRFNRNPLIQWLCFLWVLDKFKWWIQCSASKFL